jgi:transglutaminase-like putative cysteine protease
LTRHHDRLLIATEVALGLVTLSAVVGMHRLFVDGSYRGPLAAQAVVATVCAVALRRLGVRLVPAAAITAGVAVLFISWTRFPETTRWMLPTPDTLAQAGDDFAESWRLFGDVKAPAPVENGFVAATAIAIWVLVFVADWAAFRAAATLEALLPATTLFIFAAALGGPGSPIGSAAIFAAAALLYVLLHRTADQEHSSHWAGGHRLHGRTSLVGTGAALIGAAVVAGAATGPNLPAADALIAWKDISRNEPTRVVLSPMVELQANLVEQSNVEVFTVRSDRPSYWRMTSLDEFDGEIWRSSYSTEDAVGDLPRAIDTAGDGRTARQEFTIEALADPWLPAAFEPTAYASQQGGEDAVYDSRSSTLMVDSDVSDSDGYTYTVTSRLPVLDGDRLRAASTDVPDDIAERYLALPEGFSELARTEAFEVTQHADTPYDKALALQQYLRTFTYDTTVAPGHSEDALVNFLFETRRGYCEQFAGTFAALARSVDIPARVAVGFTYGVQDAYDPTLFRVRGVHAHAWPEVYLGEYGWVPFEPTPGRGPPGARSWLGIEPDQDATGGGAVVREPLEGSGDGAGDAGSVGGTDPDARNPDANVAERGTTAPQDTDDDTSVLDEPVRRASRPLGLTVLAYGLIVPLAIAVQRVVRRRHATTPAARARLAWAEATDSATRAGISLPPSLTIAERADRLAQELPAVAGPIQHLARTMEGIAYAEESPTEAEVAAAEAAWDDVATEASRRRPPWARVLAYLDVRRLFGRHGERRVAHQGPAPSPVG